MEIDDSKVFVPGITRRSFLLKNNLYDILQKDVAKPVESNDEVLDNPRNDFTPRNGKFYVPKKRSYKLKVATVGYIRHFYEKDIFETLPHELDKQQKLLLRKIRDGFSKDKITKNIALNLLNSDKPISKTSWEMLMNLNPECHNHSSQFVLWNGKCIQVSGSRGGNNKFICRHDISKIQNPLKNNLYTKSKILKKKRGLLRDSLNIKFKPGPLSKKIELENSYQKYHGGKIKLVDLPRPQLFLKPSHGTVLEPMVIKSLLQNSREEDGTISEKWAEFAVSVIGKITTKGIEIEADNSVTFDLNYKCNQNRILMQHDFDTVHNTFDNILSSNKECTTLHDPVLMLEVKEILDNIIDSVEISLNQNLFYSGADESREMLTMDSASDISRPIKERNKRKYCELDRLDVTVIRLTDKCKKNDTGPCRELFCTLGCVCDSLARGYNIKDHCEQIDCMFGCKCDFTKYKKADSLDSDCSELLPGLIHLDKKLNNKLSKEEQKFHQTVIVTDDKSILLKSKRRNWKTSKKYAEFYSNMHLRTAIKSDRFLCISVPKLNCGNIEPWCMVHNLYKCFCKGKFTQSFLSNLPQIEELNTTDNISKEKDALAVVNLMPRDPKSVEVTTVPDIIPLDEYTDLSTCDCARITPFVGRKFSDGYYLRTNEKILEMEKNDMKIQTRMLNLINKSCQRKQTNKEQNNVINKVDTSDKPSFGLDDFLDNMLHEQEELMSSTIKNNESKRNRKLEDIKLLPNRTKLKEWIETSYKKYKELVEKGLWKPILYPPQRGKVALYPWSFILSRYQEQKNVFLISKDKPLRIFMAVNAKQKLFEECINVRYIGMSHINKYPLTIRNLVNNVQNLNDTFCILYGLTLCWELVGSVTKINGNKNVESDLNTNQNLHMDSKLSQNTLSCPNNTINLENTAMSISSNNTDIYIGLSRWFVMAIENDVTEIQFFMKGFFVKYVSILKAIQLARKVGKTVRLSSQRCSDGGDGPQFGIYATPNMDENSVFVGPYDQNEPLGIETLRNPVQATNQKETRGLWIAIKKVNNAKILENPLAFMPCFKKNSDKIITLANNLRLDTYQNEQQMLLKDNSKSGSDSDPSPAKRKTGPVKTVKPIKIRKTDGFYHLAPQSLLKTLPLKKCTFKKNENFGNVDFSSSGCLSNRNSTDNKFKNLMLGNSDPKFKTVLKKPIAEIAPQIKISNITSLCNISSGDDSIRNKKSEKLVSILKPEEINNKIERRRLNNFFRVMLHDESENIKSSTVVTNKGTGLNVEEFLDSSKVCAPPVIDTYIILDDDDDFSNAHSSWRKVWITCTNIKDIGWIQGRRNDENKLSFEFPGFEYTNFYEEKEAFKKINEVLSRKVYVPKNNILKWRAVENEEEVNGERKLQLEDLSTDIVLSKKGFVHKSSLKIEKIKDVKDITEETPAVASTSTECGETNEDVSKEESATD